MSNVYGASAPGGHLYGSGFPSWLANLPASVQAQIARVGNYVIPPAAADTLNQAPSPLNNPTPVPTALQGGGPPVPPAALSAAAQPPAPMPPGAPTPPLPGRELGGGGSSDGGGASPPIGPSILPQARGVMAVMGPPQGPTPWFTPSNTPYAPNPAVGAPTPPIHPAVAAAIAGGAVSPAARAQAPAAAVAAPAQSPFVPLDYRPNADVAGGALSRGGPPQMTALDLSGLFGGGRRPAATAAAPATAQPAYKIPATRGVALTSKAPSDYGPLQRNRRWKLEGSPDLYR